MHPRLRRACLGISLALMLLSLLGMADSGYLFWKHRRSTLLTTGTGGSNFCQAGGCDLVSQGKYAEVKGIPVAAFGIAGYLALLALSVMAAALGPSVPNVIVAISIPNVPPRTMASAL